MKIFSGPFKCYGFKLILCIKKESIPVIYVNNCQLITDGTGVNNQPPPGQTEVETEKEPIENDPPPAPTEDSTVIMNKKPEDRPASFFAQPGMIAGKKYNEL